MTNQEKVLGIMKEQGKSDAIDLRNRAKDMDGTAIIREEQKIPLFDPSKDYSEWSVCSPVCEMVDGEAQIFTLIQPHNAANYPGSTPSNSPALWSICHTKDVKKAKPYLAPAGTSGMYMLDEVCTKDGKTWRSTQNDNSYPPGEVGTESFWEDITEGGE
jgi:hypothetical protein